MPLCIPTIVGPVSELSTSLRIQGALPGSTIVVVSVGANPRDIAKGIASGGDDRISLLLGATLQNGDILIALQELGGDKSPQPPKSLGLSVQDVPSVPSQLGYVGFLSHLYKCGEYLWITGAIPGTKVEVEFNGSTKGSAVALEDGARLKLSEGLPAGTVTAWQSIPAGKGPSFLVQPDSVTPRQLPPPAIKQPVLGCQTAVLVSSVYDGATVTLQRGSGIIDVAGFDRNALWLRVSKPLDEGDAISVKQNLWVRCEQNSIFSPYLRFRFLKKPQPFEDWGKGCGLLVGGGQGSILFHTTGKVGLGLREGAEIMPMMKASVLFVKEVGCPLFAKLSEHQATRRLSTVANNRVRLDNLLGLEEFGCFASNVGIPSFLVDCH